MAMGPTANAYQAQAIVNNLSTLMSIQAKRSKNMQLDQLITKFEDFQRMIKVYRALLLESRDMIGNITKNYDKIVEQRSVLNREHAGLHRYIRKFGKNPHMNDGVWNLVYSCYDNAFSADILQRVGPSLDGVMQDLDYILGTLTLIDEAEFQKTLENKPKKIETHQQIKKDYWNFVNPFWLIWKFLELLWDHKIISGTVTALITAYLIYKFGWNN